MKNINSRKEKITVIGDGGWGTTLAILLSKKGYPVTVWGAFADYVCELNKSRVNSRFLPGFKIPDAVKITHDLGSALLDKDIVVIASPSQHLRSVLKQIKKSGYSKNAVYLSVTKGIEIDTFKRMSEIIYEELGKVKLAVLSGPTIAHEVAAGVPTAAVIASANIKIRKQLQGVFMTDKFRIYTNSDVVGVELGGSLKNVIAIACGISDGLGFGSNTKASLLARGLAEISRLGVAMGAKAQTFSGISGLGDLVTTCISKYSRNRHVGEELGKGKTWKQIKSHMQMVAEGVPTAKSAHQLSLKCKISMPITNEIYSVIYNNKSPSKAVKSLMARSKKEE